MLSAILYKKLLVFFKSEILILLNPSFKTSTKLRELLIKLRKSPIFLIPAITLFNKELDCVPSIK